MLIHSEDAQKLGIESGEIVEVYSKFGSLQIETELTEDIMPGTISIPHGWGHSGSNIQLKNAQQNAGANINVLIDHDRLDPLSYTAAFNGQAVAIRKIK